MLKMFFNTVVIVLLYMFRLAQFYKDVELAEVMTDNSPKVGEILQLYEIEGEDWTQDKDDGDDEDDVDDGDQGVEAETTSEESSPTENRNPNSGSAGTKKRAQSQTPQRKPAAKKKKKT